MKSICAALFGGILLLSSPPPARADEASKNAKIEEMLQVMHADRLLTQVLGQMSDVMKNQFSKANLPPAQRQAAEERQQKMMQLLADRLSWERAKPAFVQIYSETFSESEIDGILTFYRSPAGKAMLDKMPELTQKSIAVSQQLLGDIMPDIQRIAEEQKK